MSDYREVVYDLCIRQIEHVHGVAIKAYGHKPRKYFMDERDVCREVIDKFHDQDWDFDFQNLLWTYICGNQHIGDALICRVGYNDPRIYDLTSLSKAWPRFDNYSSETQKVCAVLMYCVHYDETNSTPDGAMRNLRDLLEKDVKSAIVYAQCLAYEHDSIQPILAVADAIEHTPLNTDVYWIDLSDLELAVRKSDDVPEIPSSIIEQMFVTRPSAPVTLAREIGTVLHDYGTLGIAKCMLKAMAHINNMKGEDREAVMLEAWALAVKEVELDEDKSQSADSN